jgi:hypothetical protein
MSRFSVPAQVEFFRSFSCRQEALGLLFGDFDIMFLGVLELGQRIQRFFYAGFRQSE